MTILEPILKILGVLLEVALIPLMFIIEILVTLLTTWWEIIEILLEALGFMIPDLNDITNFIWEIRERVLQMKARTVELINKVQDFFRTIRDWILSLFGIIPRKPGEDLGKEIGEGLPDSLDLNLPSPSELMQQGIGAGAGGGTNVQMTNNIGVTAPGGVENPAAAAAAMREAARSIFSIELQKVLVSAEF